MSTVVSQSSGGCQSVGSYPHLGSDLPPPARMAAVLPPLQVWETVAVMVGAVAAIKVMLTTEHMAGILWLTIPAVLAAAALLPTWIAAREFPRLGLDRDGIRVAFTSTCRTCLCVLPIVFLGLWLLPLLGLPIPLRPAVEGTRGWLTWSVYHLLYVAVAEEVFFRGYVQANAIQVLDRFDRLSPAGRRWAAIFVSAACFAAAHVAIQGQIISAITFVPGIVLAWLFARTHTLLASILFHGVANAAYGIMAAIVSA